MTLQAEYGPQAQGVQGDADAIWGMVCPCRSARCPRIYLFSFLFAPSQAAQNEQSSAIWRDQ